MSDRSVVRRPSVVIGVAGGSGSGKTTVVRELVARLPEQPVVVLQHDWYYRDRSHLPENERSALNFDHPDAIETDLMVAHLALLLGGIPAEVPVYDFVRHARLEQTRTVRPGRAIIIEGILVLAEESLRRLMDVKLFVDTDADVRFIRRLERDVAERGREVEAVVRQYLESVRPMHSQFVEPSKRYADLIIPEGGLNTVAVDVVAARVSQYLRDGH